MHNYILVRLVKQVQSFVVLCSTSPFFKALVVCQYTHYQSLDSVSNESVASFPHQTSLRMRLVSQR